MKQAFTLVELAIVLVILGLLVGGVLAGQNLIRAAELRAVSTEYAHWQTAVLTFKEKYFALPGDMTNAEAFWGTMATGTCPAASAGTGTQTCNGNGDGRVEKQATASRSAENFQFWRQLASAGLIEGSFTGIAGSGDGDHALIGENVPSSRFSSGGWSTYHQATQPISTAYLFARSYGNIFEIGGQTTIAENWGQIFTPEEVWGIDTKLDDGKPGTGNILVRENYTNCHDGGTSTSVAVGLTANYNLSNSNVACSILLIGGFNS